jgi:hypothetical protein
MNIINLKDKIIYYRTRLWLIVGLILALVIGEFLMYRQWYLKSGDEMGLKPAGFSLERKEFDRLWKSLTEKTVEVELSQEIRYGEDIGKLEPFE